MSTLDADLHRKSSEGRVFLFGSRKRWNLDLREEKDVDDFDHEKSNPRL